MPDHFPKSCPQGVTESLHAPLLTVEVPGSNPGVGAISKTEHVRHRRGNGPENRCAHKASRVQRLARWRLIYVAERIWHSRRSGNSLVLHQFPSLRSSTAEHPPDKRETVERHHAEGPFSKRWMAQRDERRAEDPQRLARYQLQRPFFTRHRCNSKHVCVGAPPRCSHCSAPHEFALSRRHSQTEHVGAAPTCRTNSQAPEV